MTKKNGVGSNGNSPPNGAMGKLYPFTFPDTGITIHYRKVSPLLLGEADRIIPKPGVPLVDVKYGDETRREPNEADPDYQKSIDDWRVRRFRLTQKIIIERGAVVELDEERKQAVADLRAFWQAETGETLSGSDKLVYVMHIAVGSQEDLQDFIEAISRRSHPTEAAIAEHEAAF